MDEYARGALLEISFIAYMHHETQELSSSCFAILRKIAFHEDLC